MEKTENKNRFGLIGKNIDYSFSRGYFTQKFKDLQLEIKMTQKLIKASDQIYLATAKETYENQNTAHFEVIDTLKGESKSEFLANWNDSKTIIGCQSSLGFNNIDIQEDEIYLLYIVNNQLHRASEWKSGKEGLNFTHEILLVRQELSIK